MEPNEPPFIVDALHFQMNLASRCRDYFDQARRRAEFIAALERANTPFDQTNTAVEEEEELDEVVAENGQDDADDDSGEEGYQDWSTEAVEDEMPCCLIGDEMPNTPLLVLAAELVVCVRTNLLNKEQPDINQGKDAQFNFCPS